MTAIKGWGGMPRQTTLQTHISCSGIGLHSGKPITMTLRPAPANAGIRFRRLDINTQLGNADIPALWHNVVDTRLCTTIGTSAKNTIAKNTVATIEHLMAAFSGCGVDNVLVELTGGEVPVMDGSAAPFVFLIECAGLLSLAAPRRSLRILAPIEVRDGYKMARLLPDNQFSVACEIIYDNPQIGQQHSLFDLSSNNFKTEIARARTFGLMSEVKQMRTLGLALGGSLDNAVVVDEDRILNPEGLRYADEFARHKVLDAIGDLYMAGVPLIGRFEGMCSGHALNNQLLRSLFADPKAWRIEENDTDSYPIIPMNVPVDETIQYEKSVVGA